MPVAGGSSSWGVVMPGPSQGRASPSHPQAEAASEGLRSRKKPSADVRKAPEHPAHDPSLPAAVVTPGRPPVPLGSLPPAGRGQAGVTPLPKTHRLGREAGSPSSLHKGIAWGEATPPACPLHPHSSQAPTSPSVPTGTLPGAASKAPFQQH